MSKPTPKPERESQTPPPRDHSPEKSYWTVDPETGVKYKTIPKTEWVGTEGRSVLHLTEINAFDDLNGAANDYLAHLRVPPDKEEQKRLNEERARLARQQNEIYSNQLEKQVQEDAEFNEKRQELLERMDERSSKLRRKKKK